MANSLSQPSQLIDRARPLIHILLILVIVILFLLLATRHISREPYAYDEASYMSAAKQGFLANYLDSPSFSFVDYLRMGLSRGFSPSEWSKLSRLARKYGDITVYRHAHGPIYFYWLSVISKWSSDERFVRGLNLVIPILAGMVIYFGCLWLLPGLQGQICAVLGCVLYLFSSAVLVSTEVAPHQTFALWSIAVLFLLAKLMVTGSRVFWYAALVPLALALCTLEAAIFLIAAALTCCYLERRRLQIDRCFVLTSIALFAAGAMVAYPAGLIKMGTIKSVLYNASLLLPQRGMFADVPFLETWATRLDASAVALILLGIAVFLWFRFSDLACKRHCIPFVIYGVLMLAVILRVKALPLRYMLPFVSALYPFTAIVLGSFLVRLRTPVRAAVLVLVCGALLLDTQRYVQRHPPKQDRNMLQLLRVVKSRGLDSARLLAPRDDVPTLHYYFPRADITGYRDPSDLPGGRFDAIVRMTDRVRIDAL